MAKENIHGKMNIIHRNYNNNKYYYIGTGTPLYRIGRIHSYLVILSSTYIGA
jgi:hypothetical protein